MHIPTRIQAKMGEIFELGLDSFDFLKFDDPTGPSDHIRMSLQFLDNNLKMLSKLSNRVQETTLFAVCFFFNQSLIEWLTDEEDDPPKVTMNSLRQMMIDVGHLEHFASTIEDTSQAIEAFIPVSKII